MIITKRGRLDLSSRSTWPDLATPKPLGSDPAGHYSLRIRHADTVQTSLSFGRQMKERNAQR